METRTKRWSWHAVWAGWVVVYATGKVAQFGREKAGSSDTLRSLMLEHEVTTACLPLVFALAVLAPIAQRAAQRQLRRGDGLFAFVAVLFAVWPLVPGLGFPLLDDLPPELVRAQALLPFMVIGAISYFTFQGYVAVERAKSELTWQRRAWRTRSPSRAVQDTLQRIVAMAPRDAAAAQHEAALLAQWLQAAAREVPDEQRTLADELAMLQPYLELQRLRFAGRVDITVEAGPEVQTARMADALLLPLVEHSLERAIAPRGAGWLRVAARLDGRWLVLEIADDGPPPLHEGEPKEVDSVPAATMRLARELAVHEGWLELRRNERGGTTTWVRLPFALVSQVA